MRNREEGITRQPSPMGGTVSPEYLNAIQQNTQPLPTASEDLISKLMTIYNNKAYANPYAPLLSKDSALSTTIDGVGHQDDTITAALRNGERLGFLNRDRSENGTRYGIGLDNIGDPYRGVYDGETNTPLGTLDYGYDGDTVGAGFTPNAQTMAYLSALKNLLGR